MRWRTRLMDKMRTIKGLADMEYSQEGANPSTTIKINNELASDLGLSVQQIGNALRPFVAGDTVSHWLASDGQNYDVNVQLPKSGRQKVADLADLSLASSKLDANGKPIMIPLRQVVDFVPSSSPQVLKRQALAAPGRHLCRRAGPPGRRCRRRCAKGHQVDRRCRPACASTWPAMRSRWPKPWAAR